MNLGFNDMFEPFVLDGSKTHSIRAGDRWKVGMRADCYVRPRQKGMRLLFRAPVVRVEPVEIRVLTGHIDGWPRNELCPLHLKTVVLINGAPLDKDEREAFAWRDGFRQAHFKGSFFLMMWFWRRAHNIEQKPFCGQLVHWDYDERFVDVADTCFHLTRAQAKRYVDSDEFRRTVKVGRL